MRTYGNYTDEDIRRAVPLVRSVAGLLRQLGLRPVGGNYNTMRRKLARLRLNCNHWTGQGWSINQQQKDWNSYKKNDSVRLHLIRLRGSKCENCNLTEWIHMPIPIELHHMDGDRTNNQLTNLQLLCPNCHSLTTTYRGRKHRA